MAMLPTNFLLEPAAAQTTMGIPRAAATFSNECCCWVDKGLQSTAQWHDGKTGLPMKTASDTSSKSPFADVSRKTLHGLFRQLLEIEPSCREGEEAGTALKKMNYLQTKLSVARATGYDVARQLLFFGCPYSKLNKSLLGLPQQRCGVRD
eukprot:COSAG01_NODE_413_length_17368_cov_15.823672_8_plen_150_part_00